MQDNSFADLILSVRGEKIFCAASQAAGSVFGNHKLLLQKQVLEFAFLIGLTCEPAGGVADAHRDVASARRPDCAAGVLVEGKAAVQLADILSVSILGKLVVM